MTCNDAFAAAEGLAHLNGVVVLVEVSSSNSGTTGSLLRPVQNCRPGPDAD